MSGLASTQEVFLKVGLRALTPLPWKMAVEPTSSGQITSLKLRRSSGSEKLMSHVLGRFSSFMSGSHRRDGRQGGERAQVSVAVSRVPPAPAEAGPPKPDLYLFLRITPPRPASSTVAAR